MRRSSVLCYVTVVQVSLVLGHEGATIDQTRPPEAMDNIIRPDQAGFWCDAYQIPQIPCCYTVIRG